MTNEEARCILETLADGVNPVNGKRLPPDSPYDHPIVACALQLAISSIANAPVPPSIPPEKKHRSRSSWSKAENRKLKKLYEAGFSTSTISKMLQRSRRSVEKQMAKYDLDPFKNDEETARPERAGQRWTEKEDTLLNDLYIDRWTIREIAEEMQRSQYAIYRRMEKLELYGPEYGYPSQDSLQKWSSDNDCSLREMFHAGKTIEEIAAFFGRSEKSISARLFYMGLTKELSLPYLRKNFRKDEAGPFD